MKNTHWSTLNLRFVVAATAAMIISEIRQAFCVLFTLSILLICKRKKKRKKLDNSMDFCKRQ